VAVTDDLLSLGSATLGESGATPLHRRVRPIWPGAEVAAPALAVVCAAGDNLALHAAVAAASPGVALVVEIEGDPDRGYWGEVLTTGAQARQIEGLVIDGCVRDVSGVAERRFPIFGHGLALPGATKEKPGRVGGAASVGEAVVVTGDWVVADADGVVCIPSAALTSVLTRARDRAARETELFAALEGGTTTVELLGLDTAPIETVD
jgi:4-hydroxy-4-methyl-2-oxoglutarate aldolase